MTRRRPSVPLPKENPWLPSLRFNYKPMDRNAGSQSSAEVTQAREAHFARVVLRPVERFMTAAADHAEKQRQRPGAFPSPIGQTRSKPRS